MADIPIQLGLNPDETKVYNSMTAREAFNFNALPDDNAKIAYVRALVDRDRTWRERSPSLEAILLEKIINPQAAVGAWSR
ncbi:890_t:CDS:2, partial [Gigaspora rosea]